jgi:hypothetical protein
MVNYPKPDATTLGELAGNAGEGGSAAAAGYGELLATSLMTCQLFLMKSAWFKTSTTLGNAFRLRIVPQGLQMDLA